MFEITEEIGNEIYDILVKECGANEIMRPDFLIHMIGRPTTGSSAEWRFGGNFGFGGKFYCDCAGHLRVSCYQQDETPEIINAIKRANVQFKAIFVKSHLPAAQITKDIEREIIKKISEGWTANELIRYCNCMEEINPELSEPTAIKRALDITKAVAKRLADEKMREWNKLTSCK